MPNTSEPKPRPIILSGWIFAALVMASGPVWAAETETAVKKILDILPVETISKPLWTEEDADAASPRVVHPDSFFVKQTQEKADFIREMNEDRKDFFSDLKEEGLSRDERRQKIKEYRQAEVARKEKFFKKQREEAREHIQEKRS